MKTGALIDMLARGPIEVDRDAPTRRIAAATVIGLVVSAVLMMSLLGPRPDFASAALVPMFWMKFALPLTLAGCFLFAVSRLASPGGRATGPWVLAALTLAGLWTAATVDLSLVSPMERHAMVEGATAWACVISIATLSLPTFVGALFTLRGLAPTHPVWAGASAGGLAGSIAALIYAMHCNEMALPFFAVWYMLGIATPMVIGAIVGPKLLRWA